MQKLSPEFAKPAFAEWFMTEGFHRSDLILSNAELVQNLYGSFSNYKEAMPSEFAFWFMELCSEQLDFCKPFFENRNFIDLQLEALSKISSFRHC